ncbi:LysR family transcriptional regulator for bpeEF and oprC [Sinobacterium caligoides]|uniref:LysR family transcriptional regulator for bpeEF and oprC n=1 Tax=Sinobacterium caligoides TaxID=933926 RepID=A0A3N2E0F9_9GAMM|nr:LysR family transcriptional regulator [Sinobacterium caligoides]ROS05402.1 LysR family transcriptional regulator for bpeEF and oprC [Sinobacterium caligoides]
MDLFKAITTFQQVVKHKSFSAAANAMNLVPSAVSRQVSELEKWLGVRLLHRTTRSIGLTSEGRAYLAKMALISQNVAELKGEMLSTTELAGELRLTAPLILGKHVLTPVLSQFSEQYPEIDLSLFLTNRVVDLAEESYDLALRVGDLADSSLVARTLGEYQVKTLATPGYIERYGKLETPEQLKHHRCLINSAKHTPRRWLYQIDGKPVQAKVRGEIESNDPECLLAFCLQSRGIVQLPDFLASPLVKKGELVELLGQYTPPPQPVTLLFTSTKLMGPAHREMIDFLVSYFHQSPIGKIS